MVSSIIFFQLSFLYAYADTVTLDYFVSSFYHALLFFALNALFADRKFIIFNTTIFIIGFNLIIYRVLLSITDEYTLALVRAGRFHYQIAFLLIATIVYAVIWLTERAFYEIQDEIVLEKSDNDKVQSLINEIRKASKLLIQIAETLSINAFKVSSGSAQQAASIEEVSASIEEASVSLVEIANNTKQTELFSSQTADFIQKNIQNFEKTAGSVANIQKRSDEIDDIAAQTEVLAINAAIEASRSKTIHGGFSVIAVEIKKLAENTQKASNQIFQLINKSQELSVLSTESILTIQKNMVELNKRINIISIATDEQKLSFEQIAMAVLEINNAAQENASVSEQLSNLVENLKASAQLLNKQTLLKVESF
jgi:methyl-accepting chemotaxis protein